MLFKLPSDWMRRLERAAEYCGQTKQAFVQAAVQAEIVEVEETKRTKKKYRPPSIHSPGSAEEKLSTPTVPQGLGIVSAAAVAQREALEAAEQETPAPQAPVVVNVGGAAVPGGAATGKDLVEGLAGYVLGGGRFDRDHRTRVAVSILNANAATPEEQKALAQRLDQVIEQKAAQPEHQGAVAKMARLALNHVTGLLSGE